MSRWWALLGIAIVLAGITIALSIIPSDSLALIPRDPVDLTDKLLVDGKRPEPLHGKMYLVGVEERNLSMLQRILLSFDKTVSFAPRIGDEESKLNDQLNDRAIKDSKKVAAATAFELLGEPVQYDGKGAVVSALSAGTPAAELLKKGDRIVRMNGKPVKTAVDVTRAVAALDPGSKVTLGIRRDGRPAVVTLKTLEPETPDSGRKSRIGIALTTPGLKIKLPHTVKFRTTGVSGPSAALAFALSLYDAMDPGDLMRGRSIAATGALFLEGDVLEIGGAREKAIAAQNSGKDLFLVPVPNAKDARAGVKAVCSKGTQCTKIVPVRTVEQAVMLLEMSSADLDQYLDSHP